MQIVQIAEITKEARPAEFSNRFYINIKTTAGEEMGCTSYHSLRWVTAGMLVKIREARPGDMTDGGAEWMEAVFDKGLWWIEEVSDGRDN